MTMSEEDKKEMRKIVSDVINEKLIAVLLGMITVGGVLFIVSILSSW